MVQVVLIVFIHLIINKLIYNLIGIARGSRILTDAFALTQAQDNESVCIVIIRILCMSISNPIGFERPANRTSSVKQNVVIVVEATIGLTSHIDRHFHQIIGTRDGIHLG